MEKILILGAGIYQLPLIKKAKELGYYVIVVSIPGNYPGFEYADKIYYENTTDIEKVYSIAFNEKVKGICTTGTDVAVRTIGFVNEKLNLQGISCVAASLSTNKFKMKDAFKKNGVNTAKFIRAYSKNEAISFLKSVKKPIMLKPVDSSGSRGVTKVSTVEEISGKFNEIFSYTREEYIICEEYLEGIEIGIDLFVYNNELIIEAVHGKINYDNGVTNVPIGHYFPYDMTEELKMRIHEECKNVINAIGFNNCAINMDVMLVNDIPYIIEASGRCGATCIPELISRYFGIDYYAIMINVAMGTDFHLHKHSLTPCIGKLIISKTNGTIKKQNKISKDKNIEVSFDYKNGDKVNKFMVGPDRIGHIIKNGLYIDEKEEIEIEVI